MSLNLQSILINYTFHFNLSFFLNDKILHIDYLQTTFFNVLIKK